jgi:hypothetical protein
MEHLRKGTRGPEQNVDFLTNLERSPVRRCVLNYRFSLLLANDACYISLDGVELTVTSWVKVCVGIQVGCAAAHKLGAPPRFKGCAVTEDTAQTRWFELAPELLAHHPLIAGLTPLCTGRSLVRTARTAWRHRGIFDVEATLKSP